jgi:hypothetical protein
MPSLSPTARRGNQNGDDHQQEFLLGKVGHPSVSVYAWG